MKNKILIIFILSSLFSISQNVSIKSKYDFIYYCKINTHIIEEYDCTLSFDNINSLFLWNKIGNSDLQINEEGHYTKAEHLKSGEFNYCNQSKNLIVSKSFVSKKEYHYVSQDSIEIKWNITNEQKRISGYNCFKATGVYGDRNYIAWYTPEIPTNFGPWKLHGLNGLIISVEDESKEILFTLKRVVKNNEEKEIDILDKKLVSLKKYYQRVVDYPFETLSMMQSKASKNSKIKIAKIRYNFLEKQFETLGREEFKNED
ncbi:MAG: GLPGLI family protein [Flavobacterium sp.]|nr:GLPGLI family protein [Flavobacterium sp.]